MKKFKIILITILILFLLGMTSLFGIDLIVRSQTADYIIESNDIEDFTADYILILGAGIYPDGRPSPMLKERLDTGIEMYESGLSDKIIVSGDHMREDHDEVNAMKNYLTISGVPSDAIYMDHAGISTYDSIYRAKEYFAASSLVIVTQKYHLYRALYIGKNLGLDCIGANATRTTYSGQTYRDTREFLARIKDFIKCLIKPSSYIGGEAIPVSKGGNITNDKDFILIKSDDSNEEKYINSNKIIETFERILDENLSKQGTFLPTNDEIDYLTLTMPDGNEYELLIIEDKVYLNKDDKFMSLKEEDTSFIIDVLKTF